MLAGVVALVGVFIWFSPQIFSGVTTLVPSSESTITPSVENITQSNTSTVQTNASTSTYAHEELVNYALSLINGDRQKKGLQNVTLSNIDSGQRHADDMLKQGYFSHWDTQGFKPYMRYTLAGGQGAVAENCASLLGSYANLTEELDGMEWKMVNDDAESGWGHRDTILNGFYNKVSIGIAYDGDSVYLVQDFEADLVSWSTLQCANKLVTMRGTLLKTGLSIQSVFILYDMPQNLTVQQLSNSPYQDSYGPGASVGMALPPGWTSGEGVTITASTWNVTESNFEIKFDLSSAIDRYGNGVYTLYLMTGESTDSSLTTFSVWCFS